MKTLIPAKRVYRVMPVGTGLLVELEMDEAQMYAALNGFLEHVSDDTWTKWQKQINTEIYGEAKS